MKQKIVNILRDQNIRRGLWIFSGLMLLYAVILIWRWKKLPPELPLFYSLPRGNEQLGSPFNLILLPFLSVLIFGLQFIMAVLIYPQEKLAAKLLISTALIMTFLLFIAFVKIIFLVT